MNKNLSTIASIVIAVVLSGCDRIGDLALTCSGTEKRVHNSTIRDGEPKDIAVTVIRDWLGNPKSIHFATKLGSKFNSVYCEKGKGGEQIFKSPDCNRALDTVTLYPEHGKITVFYHASEIVDWYEADLNCTKAKGFK